MPGCLDVAIARGGGRVFIACFFSSQTFGSKRRSNNNLAGRSLAGRNLKGGGLVATSDLLKSRPRVFDLSPKAGDNGWMLFLAELDERATLGSRLLPVAGEGQIRLDVSLPGFSEVSIEIFAPVRVIDPGGDPRRIRFRPVEFIFSDEAPFSVVEGQLEYTGDPSVRFPGITSSFNEAGYMVSLRVERAGFIGSTVQAG